MPSVKYTALILLLLCTVARAGEYDPLAAPADVAVRVVDTSMSDPSRQRELPMRLFLPQSSSPAPVVLFSHGLGGTCKVGGFLGEHWAARGYVVVYVQHPGSDDSVWKDEPAAARLAALRRAASLENFVHRVQDVKAVLDQLEKWNQEDGHVLAGRLDLGHVGMSGHSFGAITTQAVSGQTFPLIGQRYTDPRIRAAIAFSPSSPQRGGPAKAFGSVEIPWLLMTGTKDSAPIGNSSVASRLGVYPHLPTSIDRYEVVLGNAEHSAFSDRALPGDKEPRNPNHHRVILALSTAFWDTYLRGDEAARTWLHRDGPRSVLEQADRWQYEVAGAP